LEKIKGNPSLDSTNQGIGAKPQFSWLISFTYGFQVSHKLHLALL